MCRLRLIIRVFLIVSLSYTPAYSSFLENIRALFGSEANDKSFEKAYPVFTAHAVEVVEIPFLAKNYVPQGLSVLNRERLVLGLYHDENEASILAIAGKDIEPVKIKLMEPDGRLHAGHMGGIAVSDQYLWIASSGYILKADLKDLEGLLTRKNDLEELVLNLRQKIRLPHRASAITYNEGKLYIAEFAVNTRSNPHLYIYPEDVFLGETEDATSVGKVNLPPKVQGLAFTESGKLCLSTSYGPSPSVLLIGEIVDSDFVLHSSFEMPAGSEGIVLLPGANKLFISFESAAMKYKKRWELQGAHITDQIWLLDVDIDKEPVSSL